MLSGYLTVGELAMELEVPVWKIRRVVDAIGNGIPRVGQYRVIPRQLVEKVRGELERTGWLK